MTFDARLTPARPDLAAEHLKDRVRAARYAAPVHWRVTVGHTGLHPSPSADSEQASELLFGEIFAVYETRDGWAWGQSAMDDYVGYARLGALAPIPAEAPSSIMARVAVLSTPLLSAPDVRAPLRDLLPMNAHIAILGTDKGYARIETGYVYEAHLAAPDATSGDWVAIAEEFLHAPYVWGGRTVAGLDCSGLIQVARQAAGHPTPRDTDMQQSALGRVADDAPARGDLVFWKGHVGVMLDSARLLHANAFHMQVAIEPLQKAMARIEPVAGPIRAIKRV
jgi:hypothetical protein